MRKKEEPNDNKIEITQDFLMLLNQSSVLTENKPEKIEHFLKVGRKFSKRNPKPKKKIVPSISKYTARNLMDME